MAKALARFAVRSSVLVNLLGVSLVIVGAVTLQEMTRESIPAVPTGWARVMAVYPGASAEEVEQLVITPLESAVADVDEIAELWGVAQEGVGFLFIQFEPSVTDQDRKVLEVQAEVAGVNDLPEGVEPPTTRRFSVNVPTLAIAVRGEVPELVLRRVGNDLADKVEKVEGVSGVGRNGIRERRVTVDVDPTRLAAHRLPLTAVADALRMRAANVPAGSVGDRDARLVRGMTQVGDADDIRDVVIRPDPTGGAVRVGDVAEVSDGFAPARLTGRIQGEPGILLLVRKETIADSLTISEDVHAVVDGMELPDGVSAEIFGDVAHEVRRSLGSLYGNAATGLVLVLVLLWFFVGGRNATMAALGLPVALAGALIAMHWMGITINVISLLALILCLGIVVDDAIIIIENVYRHMEEGKPRREAAVIGTAEVFWPVVSSTMTTLAAFLPLLLMTGVLGKFFAIIPKVVIASLVASLIEAFFILPSHMADFGKVKRRQSSERPKTRWERIGERVGEVYERWLKGALKRRKLVVFSAYVLASGLVYAAYATKDVVLFTDGDVDMFDVRIQLPTDATKAETDEVLREVEQRLLAYADPNVEAIVAARGLTRTAMGVDRGDHVGMVTVYMKPQDLRESLRSGTQLLERASGAMDDIVGPVSLEVIEYRPGPPRGAPVAVRIFGDDLGQITELGRTVADEVRQTPGARNVAIDFELGKREMQVEVDEERAAMHLLTPPQVALWLRNAFGAFPVATLRDGDEEIELVVRLDDEARADASKLESLTLVTPDGSSVRLGDIATIVPGRGPAVIRHRDRERVVKVTSQIDDGETSAEVNRRLLERLEPLMAANPDVRFELGGEYERTNESLESLANAFIIALLLVYTILATQFRSLIQPLVVMAAIPLSFIGVVIGFFVSGAPIGLIALIGVVGLAGIVVNDSLVLVDFINQRRRQGMELDEAIVTASKLRLRPIFLTSITTVAGLFPLALAGEAAPLLSPMATAIAWGLSFATVLTLILVPCLYRIAAGASAGMGKVFGPVVRWATDPGDAAVEEPGVAE
ncbi:MAG: efflux RND transporter permease subunit [Deltaproteobacteria bacterium]|nr:efflux RND transporter permease subunit [Deltaproteobacteria bacterium]